MGVVMIGSPKLIHRLAAPSTAFTGTGSDSESVRDSYVFPANFWVPGKMVQWRGIYVQTAVNGTDTLQVRCRLGPTTLTGTVVADSTAVAGATTNVFGWDLFLLCISSSEIRAWGHRSILGVGGTVTMRATHVAVTSLDFTAALRAEVTAVYGAASASNSSVAVGNLLAEYT